jgi:hypothetical protein
VYNGREGARMKDEIEDMEEYLEWYEGFTDRVGW